jgi:tetratricopeptide (TPR) repeat protein
VLIKRLALVFCCGIGALPAQDLELRGRLDPPSGNAVVVLWGATTPYNARTTADGKGRFRFRRLAPGSYTVSILQPDRSEFRRTVNLSKRVTEIVIPIEDPAEEALRAAERHSQVSVRELGIPGKARAAFHSAQRRLGRHDVEGAVADLRRALDIAPAFLEARNNLGTILYQQRRYEDAERCFREALAYEPGAYAPTVNLGGVLLNLKRPAEALVFNQDAVTRQPSDALAQSQLGITLVELGRFDEAERHLLEAVRLDPGHFSHPQIVLATVYARRGKLHAAAAQIENFLKHHPEAPNAPSLRQQADSFRRAAAGLPPPDQ